MSPDKAELRSLLRDRLRQLSHEERLRESARIVERLAPRLARGLVAAFAPMPEEVILWPLLETIAASGRLVLPRVDGEHVALHRVAHLAALRSGPMRLREPAPDAPVVAPDEVDVFLVPGLGFTRDGRRIGRGRGYYDRLLADAREDVPRLGVCYACQLVDTLPTEPHDMRCSEVYSSLPESP